LTDIVGAFIERPWLAFVPAACFLAVYRARRLKLSAIAAVTWAVYGAYEYSIRWRWLCSGECDIRVDLLLIYPVILLISLVAVVGAAVAVLRRRPVTAP